MQVGELAMELKKIIVAKEGVDILGSEKIKTRVKHFITRLERGQHDKGMESLFGQPKDSWTPEMIAIRNSFCAIYDCLGDLFTLTNPLTIAPNASASTGVKPASATTAVVST